LKNISISIDPSASQRTFINTDRPDTQESQMSTATSRSTLQGVIRGVGEMDVYNNYRNRYSTLPPTPKTANSEQINLEYEERPYLIVDLRDKDEFNLNHIVSGDLFLKYNHNLMLFCFYII
jgi:hypothetical protein